MSGEEPKGSATPRKTLTVRVYTATVSTATPLSPLGGSYVMSYVSVASWRFLVDVLVVIVVPVFVIWCIDGKC